MIMRSRSHRKINGITILVFLGGVVLCGSLILFNGTLFRVGAFVLDSVTLPRSLELEMIPKHILAARVADSEKELATIRYQAVLYEATAQENARLKEVLSLIDTDDVSFGRVIARPPKTQYDTLLVRVQDMSAVAVADQVFFNGLFIGEVTRAEDAFVLVTLFSNPGSLHEVQVGTPSAVVSLRGLGGGSFTFSIPNEIDVIPGDIVTSVLDSSLVVAVVESVQTKDDSTSKKVFAHNAVSFSDIDFVSFRSP